MRKLELTLTAAFDRAKNERELQPFLKKHLTLVQITLNVRAWNYVKCFPEYKFGADYRADFLILSAHSGFWNAIFVELKSHRLRPFTLAGLPSRSLNTALRQLDDWERWIKRNENALRADLARRLSLLHVCSQCSRVDRHTLAETELTDRRTMIDFHYRVVMGRRTDLSPEDQERRFSQYLKGRELVTFDRFLDTARRLGGGDPTIPPWGR